MPTARRARGSLPTTPAADESHGARWGVGAVLNGVGGHRRLRARECRALVYCDRLQRHDVRGYGKRSVKLVHDWKQPVTVKPRGDAEPALREALYAANPVVSRRDEADGTLLYNPDVDDVGVINGSGLALWLFLAEPRSLAEIAAHISATYDGVDAEQAAADTAAFVEQLSPTYVIEVSEEGTAAADEADSAPVGAGSEAP